jgi:hypothetical protein
VAPQKGGCADAGGAREGICWQTHRPGMREKKPPGFFEGVCWEMIMGFREL